jgi:hypothetical protein
MTPAIAEDPESLVHLDRLLQFCDPFAALGFAKPSLDEISKLRPFAHIPERRRTRRYHLPRIAHFVRDLREKNPLDPILIDNVCSHGHITAQPIVTDGHHRLAAHLLLGLPHINAVISGRVDVIDWLTGKSDHHPDD